MNNTNALILFGMMIILSLVCMRKMDRVVTLENHIQYLEEYIEENNLPTPAMRNLCPDEPNVAVTIPVSC